MTVLPPAHLDTATLTTQTLPFLAIATTLVRKSYKIWTTTTATYRASSPSTLPSGTTLMDSAADIR